MDTYILPPPPCEYPCDQSPRTYDIVDYRLRRLIPYKMRQRITFFHKNEHGIDPASLKISGRSFSGPDIIAEREERITLALEELPVELQELVRGSRELYLRWQAPDAYETVGPWPSRIPPGLHIFYTPGNGGKPDGERLCRLFRGAFGSLDCSSSVSHYAELSGIMILQQANCFSPSSLSRIGIIYKTTERSIHSFNCLSILQHSKRPIPFRVVSRAQHLCFWQSRMCHASTANRQCLFCGLLLRCNLSCSQAHSFMATGTTTVIYRLASTT